MKLQIQIDLENDAMQTGPQIAGALCQVIAQLNGAYPEKAFPYGRPIRDENGNQVGTWEVIDQKTQLVLEIPTPTHKCYLRLDEAIQNAKPANYIVAMESISTGYLSYFVIDSLDQVKERKYTVMQKPLVTENATGPALTRPITSRPVPHGWTHAQGGARPDDAPARFAPFTESEKSLMVEALRRLGNTKSEAFETVLALPSLAKLTRADFGLPTIQTLIDECEGQ